MKKRVDALLVLVLVNAIIALMATVSLPKVAGPSVPAATIAGPHEADGKSDLAAGRAGQELAQPHQIGISLFVEPAPAHDELVAEIPDMSDRPAEAGDAQSEEDKENFQSRTCLPVFSLGRVPGDRHGYFPISLAM
jgi:hypothetical protein